MKLTPLDIQQMQFKVRLRGYDRREVDRFLEELAQTVEGLNRDNAGLRDRLASTDAQLADLKKSETALAHTLVSAQALTDDLKQAAQRDAELIMREAELKASELLQETRTELAALQRDLSDLYKQRVLAIERMRSTVRTFERMLAIEAGEEDQPHPNDRAENVAGGANF
ncbi:MAG: DivIVA domain-containing protein [Nitrospira sp.]|nr:DivIVA domain-containing protein [Nitrospira sp.]